MTIQSHKHFQGPNLNREYVENFVKLGQNIRYWHLGHTSVIRPSTLLLFTCFKAAQRIHNYAKKNAEFIFWTYFYSYIFHFIFRSIKSKNNKNTKAVLIITYTKPKKVKPMDSCLQYSWIPVYSTLFLFTVLKYN